MFRVSFILPFFIIFICPFRIFSILIPFFLLFFFLFSFTRAYTKMYFDTIFAFRGASSAVSVTKFSSSCSPIPEPVSFVFAESSVIGEGGFQTSETYPILFKFLSFLHSLKPQIGCTFSFSSSFLSPSLKALYRVSLPLSRS